jgi:hypothetical protein
MALVYVKPIYRERSWVKENPRKGTSDVEYLEYLAWPCQRCGYEEVTKTADQT